MTEHQPVLLKEVIRILNLTPGKNIIDATCGSGGHTKEIAKKITRGGKVLAIDWDKEMLKKAKQNLKDFQETIIFKQGNYANIKNILSSGDLNHLEWSGILFDFGFSLNHLKDSGRGFSFLKDEPLDMRYSLENKLTAGKILNQYPKEDLVKIFYQYGEEKWGRKIAAEAVKYRKNKKIETTSQLNEIIKKAISPRFLNKWTTLTKHSASRIYQALRIEVNNELENIKRGLAESFNILKNGGIVAAISFHSLEDRIVKNFLKEKQKDKQALILTKKPITPTPEEIMINPRARSAKLRAGMKITQE